MSILKILGTKHAITEELLRQKKQGYFESKKGTVYPYFNFSIFLKQEDFHGFMEDTIGSIAIEKGDKHGHGIIYRNENKYGYAGRDGKGLLKCPSSFYEPIHKVFRDLAKIIGENGKASYSFVRDTDGDNGPGWSWTSEHVVNSLDEALEKYRFAWLRYQSPIGAELEFGSADSEENTGKLEIKIPLSKIDKLSIKRIDQVAKYFERLKINS